MDDFTTSAGAETRPRNIGRRIPARILEELLARWLARLSAGRLTVTFPDGRMRSFAGENAGPRAAVTVHDSRLAIRLAASGHIGFAEGYMHGDWDSPDPTALLRLGAANEVALSAVLGASAPMRLVNRGLHALRANTRRGSRRNIAAHYDLGNDFYRLWLDETMTYSAALFEAEGEELEAAQRRKYRRLATAIDLRPGDRVLEIGCGWGGFAEIAAREFGCEAVCLTLSREQAAFARRRIARAGLGDAVEIVERDYRDIDGRFDKVVSIEMFEAVGEENWPTYFASLDRVLVAGGRAALQVITIDDGRFASYRRTPDFIQRYIFPGGVLPGPAAFEAAAARGGFRIADAHWFGKSYAETLRRWRHAFEAAAPRIAGMGFPERFHRMWRYYLCYCEAGFEERRLDVGQFVLERR